MFNQRINNNFIDLSGVLPVGLLESSPEKDQNNGLSAFYEKLNVLYAQYLEEQSNELLRDQARDSLMKLLNKQLSTDLAIKEKRTKQDQIINEEIGKIKLRERARFFNPGSTKSLSEQIDRAWAVYKNSEASTLEREAAQDFLIYAFDIEELENNLNEKLSDLINKKSELTIVPRLLESGEVNQLGFLEVFKADEALQVRWFSKIKDAGRLWFKNTIMFTPEERNCFRVDLHGGLFKSRGEILDTSDSTSHSKVSFAGFTLNFSGELHCFQHKNHNITQVSHSSLTNGENVFCAGELKIQHGKLVAITTYSGHYGPKLYHLYKTLQYFKARGVDISGSMNI